MMLFFNDKIYYYGKDQRNYNPSMVFHVSSMVFHVLLYYVLKSDFFEYHLHSRF